MSHTNFLTRKVATMLTKSLWAYHLNTGSCNGCDMEIMSTVTPRYDIERFGIVLKGTPRHADVLLVTGPVSRLMKEKVKRIYAQMPWPKFVFAIGTCTSTGAPYQECYNQCGGLDQVILVDMYIPGCPPRPEAIIQGIYKFVEQMWKKVGIIPET
ncbi:MAG: NADH-quinone oxidoreductase subunit B family protein [Candidatus Hermodarchaeota archaeon]